MQRHRFKVGQMVNFHPNERNPPPTVNGYEVRRLLPSEDGQNQYQIKSVSEIAPRIAKERDLSPRRAT